MFAGYVSRQEKPDKSNEQNRGAVVGFLDEVWSREMRDERVYLVCGFVLLSGIKETRPTRKTK
jgi:hypothetical protein